MAATRRMLRASTRTPASACRAAPTSRGGQLRRRPRGGGGGSMNRLNMIVQGPDIEQLQALLERPAGARQGRSRASPTPTRASRRQQPELRITIDRQRAADIGVPLESVSSSLRTFVGGEEVSKFKDGDEQYSVRMRLDEQFRQRPAGDGRPVRPGQRRPHGARERRRAPDHGERAGVDRALQPHAPVLGQRQPRPRADDARRGPGRRPGRRSASSA